MSIVYIAGPMTGLPDFNRPAFFAAEQILKAHGHIVLNPAVLPDGLEYEDYMGISEAMLIRADCIYLLNGWEHSQGAMRERSTAIARNMFIEYQAGN